ncbi:MAG: TlpA disulfide reductase family protein [Bacteroidota bacterium]
MKNKLIIIAVFCLVYNRAAAQQKTVTLTGTLVHFANQVVIDDMSEFQYLDLPTTERLIAPDEKGNFTLTFNLSAPNYFRLGRNALYLSPGDKLDMVVDYANPVVGTFRGTGAEANSYLVNTPFPKGGSFLDAGKYLAQNPKETFDHIIAAGAIRTKQLDELRGVSPEFRRLEEARIKADVLNSFNDVEVYAGIKKIKDIELYMKSFNNYADPIKTQYQLNFIDASLMKLVVYRDVAEDFVKNAPASADVSKIKDWYTASNLVNKMSRESDKVRLAVFNKSIDSIKTPSYNASLKAYLKGKQQFGKGDLAVDFTAVDATGKKVSLSSLKGKVIYVDMWATWCGPCLAEMPKLEEIKASYKDNADVVFLSLSIDDDNEREKWKKNMAARKVDGYQWQINRGKLNAYNVTTIPRTLLIDKNFKMVSLSAPLPSAKDLPAEIDKLLAN